MMGRTAKHWSEDTFPANLISKNGEEKVAKEALEGKRVVAVLFSAHWCGPCRAFAPKLISFYNACKKKEEDALEVVFVSSDRDNEAFQKYFEIMPWLAVSLEDTAATSKLAGLCKVRGIPLLAVFDGATGKILSLGGRADISNPMAESDPLAIVEKWLSNNPGPKKQDSPWLSNAILLLVVAAATAVYYGIRMMLK